MSTTVNYHVDHEAELDVRVASYGHEDHPHCYAAVTFGDVTAFVRDPDQLKAIAVAFRCAEMELRSNIDYEAGVHRTVEEMERADADAAVWRATFKRATEPHPPYELAYVTGPGFSGITPIDNAATMLHPYVEAGKPIIRIKLAAGETVEAFGWRAEPIDANGPVKCTDHADPANHTLHFVGDPCCVAGGCEPTDEKGEG